MTSARRTIGPIQVIKREVTRVAIRFALPKEVTD